MFKPSPLRARARPKTLIFLILAVLVFYTSWTAYIRDRRNIVIWRHGQTATPPDEPTNKPLVPPSEPSRPEPPSTPKEGDVKQDSELRKQEDNKKTEEDEKAKELEKQQSQKAVNDEIEKNRILEEALRKKKEKAEKEAKKKKEKEEAEAKKKKKEQETEAARSRHEQQLRDQFAAEYEAAKK